MTTNISTHNAPPPKTLQDLQNIVQASGYNPESLPTDMDVTALLDSLVLPPPGDNRPPIPLANLVGAYDAHVGTNEEVTSIPFDRAEIVGFLVKIGVLVSHSQWKMDFGMKLQIQDEQYNMLIRAAKEVMAKAEEMESYGKAQLIIACASAALAVAGGFLMAKAATQMSNAVSPAAQQAAKNTQKFVEVFSNVGRSGEMVAMGLGTVGQSKLEFAKADQSEAQARSEEASAEVKVLEEFAKGLKELIKALLEARRAADRADADSKGKAIK